MAIPSDIHVATEEMMRHRVVGAGDFDVAVGMDAARAALEERERLGRQRTEGGLFNFKEVAPHLASGRTVDAESGDGAIPVLQERILLVEAVEAATLERVVLDVASGALLLSVFLGIGRS